jgi:hypothetical protein
MSFAALLGQRTIQRFQGRRQSGRRMKPAYLIGLIDTGIQGSLSAALLTGARARGCRVAGAITIAATRPAGCV